MGGRVTGALYAEHLEEERLEGTEKAWCEEGGMIRSCLEGDMQRVTKQKEKGRRR